MSKHNILTEDDFIGFKVNTNLINIIDKYKSDHKIHKSQINILD